MEKHTIQASDPTYQLFQLLLERAASLKTTPEQLIKRLLAVDASALFADAEDTSQSSDALVADADHAEALAAVHRLTTLFADVKIDNLEQLLNDPMLALENANLPE